MFNKNIILYYVYKEDFSFENDTCKTLTCMHLHQNKCAHLRKWSKKWKSERERRQGSGQSHRPQDLTLCFCMERKATWAASVCVSSMFYAFCLFVMISDSAEGRTLGSGVQWKGGGRAGPSLLRRTWSCLLKLASAPVAGYTVITHGLHNTAACAGKLLG